MMLLEMFIEFSTKIMNFKVMNITIFNYLITFTTIIFIFNIIKILTNSNKKANKGSE